MTERLQRAVEDAVVKLRRMNRSFLEQNQPQVAGAMLRCAKELQAAWAEAEWPKEPERLMAEPVVVVCEEPPKTATKQGSGSLPRQTKKKTTRKKRKAVFDD